MITVEKFFIEDNIILIDKKNIFVEQNVNLSIIIKSIPKNDNAKYAEQYLEQLKVLLSDSALQYVKVNGNQHK